MNMINIKKINIDYFKKYSKQIFNIILEFKINEDYEDNYLFFVDCTIASLKAKEIDMYGIFYNDLLLAFISVEEKNYIGNLFVKKAYQRLGLGSLLFNYILNDCINKNIDKIEVCSYINAVEFYKRLGFIEKNNNSKEYMLMSYNIKEMENKNGKRKQFKNLYYVW